MTMPAPSPSYPYMPPPATPTPRNGFGTAALVLGIVGAIFAFIPVIGVIAWPMVIVGLILGILGIQRARKGVATNKGMSIAGTALSAFGLALCIVWTIAVGAVAAKTPVPATLPTVLPTAPAAPTLPTGQAPAAQAPKPGTIPGNGTFTVGSDIQPGTYKTAGPASAICYYARLKDTSGDFSAIINNNTTQGPATVTIATTDGAFQTTGCQTWTKVN
jgi:hypothetical protein